MPSIDNCRECNRNKGEQFPYKEKYNDGRYQQPIHVDRLQKRRTPIHDQLGKKELILKSNWRQKLKLESPMNLIFVTTGVQEG